MITTIAPTLGGRAWVLFSRVQAPTGMLIKIEATRALAARVRDLDEDSPFEVGVIGLMETRDPLEAARAIQREHQSVRVKGAWFQPSTPLLVFIEKAAQADLRALVEHMGPTPPGTITVEELAQHLRCSVPTIYRHVQNGQLPHFRVGRQIRFVLSEVVPYIQRTAPASGSTSKGA